MALDVSPELSSVTEVSVQMRLPCHASAHSPTYFRRPVHTDSLEIYIMLTLYQNVQLHVYFERNNCKTPPFPAGVEDQRETAMTLNCPHFYWGAQLGCKAPALSPLQQALQKYHCVAPGAFQRTAAGALALSKHSLGPNHGENLQG